MEVAKRALCYNEAKEKGLVFADYEFKGLPEDFTAILKYKVWGKSMNLLLFVEDQSDGSKYCLSVFRRHENKLYTPRKMSDFDLTSKEIQPGVSLVCRTKTTRSGNTDLLEVKIL